MKARLALITIVSVGLLFPMGDSLSYASPQQFTTLDHPKAGTGTGQGTTASDINTRGDVLGYYASRSGSGMFLLHGRTYLPLASPQLTIKGVIGAYPMGINDRGDVVGTYVDSRGRHGFLLQQNRFTIFNHPQGAMTIQNRRMRLTSATDINNRADIVGMYVDSKGVMHGFLRHRGKYTTLTHPRAGTSDGDGTQATGINDQGDIVGVYSNSTGSHGFVLRDHRYTTLGYPGAGGDTSPMGVNEQGMITGFYVDRNGVHHGFIWQKGQFTKLDHPLAGTRGGQGTNPARLNDRGAIVGHFIDKKGVPHGFLWH